MIMIEKLFWILIAIRENKKKLIDYSSDPGTTDLVGISMEFLHNFRWAFIRTSRRKLDIWRTWWLTIFSW